MGIKRTRKLNKTYIGGKDKRYEYHKEVDWGYTGDYAGQNCYDLKQLSKKVECAKKKFFSHCEKSKKGAAFCSTPLKGDDKNRQNFYRKIVIEDCENDARACAKVDEMGDPQKMDDMCVYVGVCDDGMPAYEIPSTIKNVYGELKATVDSVFGDWREMAKGDKNRENAFKKKKIKRLKNQMREIVNNFNSENADKLEAYTNKKSSSSAEDDELEFGESQQGGSQQDPTTRQKYEAKKLEKCKREIVTKNPKNIFEGANAQYKKYLIEKDALKNAGFSLSKDRENEAKASLTIKGKIKGLKKCLSDFTSGDLKGIAIFKKYADLEEKIAKLKNRKTIKRLKDAFKSLQSKKKAISAQRQAFTDKIASKAMSLSGKVDKSTDAGSAGDSESAGDAEFD